MSDLATLYADSIVLYKCVAKQSCFIFISQVGYRARPLFTVQMICCCAHFPDTVLIPVRKVRVSRVQMKIPDIENLPNTLDFFVEVFLVVQF